MNQQTEKSGKNNPRRCPDCGFRIRGENHEEGAQHRSKREWNKVGNRNRFGKKKRR